MGVPNILNNTEPPAFVDHGVGHPDRAARSAHRVHPVSRASVVRSVRQGRTHRRTNSDTHPRSTRG
jgi:hypothetical protein